MADKTRAITTGLVEISTVLNAVVTTTTSSLKEVSGWTAISIQCIAADISTGNGVFTVEVSNDGTNWKQLQSLITNVTAQTKAASITLSADGNELVFLDKNLRFNYIRVKCTRTTDGTYSAILYVQY